MDIIEKEKKCAKIASTLLSYNIVGRFTFQSPETKTLYSLWKNCGLPEYYRFEAQVTRWLKYAFMGSGKDRIACLTKWVYVLYGPTIAGEYKLDESFERNFSRLGPLSVGNIRFAYREPFKNMLAELSHHLPYYDETHEIKLMSSEIEHARYIAGHYKDQFEKAYALETGEDRNIDEPEAFKLYKEPADAGHIDSMAQIGLMYAEGRGCERDDDMAIKYILEAARKGDVSSQANIGVLYLNGFGTTKSLTNAYIWFSVAASQGDEVAEQYLQEISDAHDFDELPVCLDEIIALKYELGTRLVR